jgi:hypothetical protein
MKNRQKELGNSDVQGKKLEAKPQFVGTRTPEEKLESEFHGIVTPPNLDFGVTGTNVFESSLAVPGYGTPKAGEGQGEGYDLPVPSKFDSFKLKADSAKGYNSGEPNLPEKGPSLTPPHIGRLNLPEKGPSLTPPQIGSTITTPRTDNLNQTLDINVPEPVRTSSTPFQTSSDPSKDGFKLTTYDGSANLDPNLMNLAPQAGMQASYGGPQKLQESLPINSQNTEFGLSAPYLELNSLKKSESPPAKPAPVEAKKPPIPSLTRIDVGNYSTDPILTTEVPPTHYSEDYGTAPKPTQETYGSNNFQVGDSYDSAKGYDSGKGYLGNTNLSLDPIIENFEEESRGKFSTESRKYPSYRGDKEEVDFNISSPPRSIRSRQDDDLYSPDILKTRAENYLHSGGLEDSLYGDFDLSNPPQIDESTPIGHSSLDLVVSGGSEGLKIEAQPFE